MKWAAYRQILLNCLPVDATHNVNAKLQISLKPMDHCGDIMEPIVSLTWRPKLHCRYAAGYENRFRSARNNIQKIESGLTIFVDVINLWGAVDKVPACCQQTNVNRSEWNVGKNYTPFKKILKKLFMLGIYHTSIDDEVLPAMSGHIWRHKICIFLKFWLGKWKAIAIPRVPPHLWKSKVNHSNNTSKIKPLKYTGGSPAQVLDETLHIFNITQSASDITIKFRMVNFAILKARSQDYKDNEKQNFEQTPAAADDEKRKVLVAVSTC